MNFWLVWQALPGGGYDFTCIDTYQKEIMCWIDVRGTIDYMDKKYIDTIL